MTMSIELPTELQAFVTAQVEAGRCASEQDLVVQLVTLARQSGYMELRDEVQRSVAEAGRGETRAIDMDAVIERGYERMKQEGITD